MLEQQQQQQQQQQTQNQTKPKKPHKEWFYFFKSPGQSKLVCVGRSCKSGGLDGV